MKFSVQVKEEIVNLVLSVEIYPDMRTTALDLVERGLSRLLPHKASDRDQVWSDVNGLCERSAVDGRPAVASFVQAIATLRSERPETQRLLGILAEAGFDTVPSQSSDQVRFEKPDLTAIQYARVHREARQRVQELRTLAEQLRLKSFEQRATSLLDALRAELYRVTITGKSRAGKSTLLNQLIERDICPAKRTLTTSVPIIIGPGENERILVEFQRGRPHRLDGPITADMLRPYADHACNPRNEKGVESIEVSLAGSVLDLGVEYVDVPGIDDPSTVVWERAQEVVDDAHALIIVIDVAPHATGSFTVDRQVRELVEAACGRDAPIFIVGNKADVLDRESREEVRAILGMQLLELGLPVDDLRGPYIVSASAGARAGEEQADLAADYDRFDRDLWQHLWRNHDIGVRRLHAIFQHVGLAAQELAAIFAVRDKSEPERSELRIALGVCTGEKRSVLAQVDDIVEGVVGSLSSLLQPIREAVPAEVEAAFESIGDAADMEKVEAQLRAALERRLAPIGVAIIEQLERDLQPLCFQADQSLTKLRERIGILRDVNGFHAGLSNLDVRLAGLSGATREKQRRWLGRGLMLGSTFLGGLLMFSNPVAAVGAATFATVSVSLAEKLGRTPRSRPDLKGQAKAEATKALDRAQADMTEQLKSQARSLRDKLRRHMAPFLRDVRERLRDLEPPSDEERALHEQMHAGVEHVLRTLVDALAEADPGTASEADRSAEHM